MPKNGSVRLCDLVEYSPYFGDSHFDEYDNLPFRILFIHHFHKQPRKAFPNK